MGVVEVNHTTSTAVEFSGMFINGYWRVLVGFVVTCTVLAAQTFLRGGLKSTPHAFILTIIFFLFISFAYESS